MISYGDVLTWDGFLEDDILLEKFVLQKEEFGAWAASVQSMQIYWQDILTQQRGRVQKGDWLSIFHDDVAISPFTIWQPKDGYQMQRGIGTIEIAHGVKLFKTNSSGTPMLHEIPKSICDRSIVPVRGGRGIAHRFTGIVKRIQVVTVKQEPKKQAIMLHYGKIDSLPWDLGKFVWKGSTATPLMNYTTKLGRDLLRKHHVIPSVVEKKWSGILPRSFKLRWMTI